MILRTSRILCMAAALVAALALASCASVQRAHDLGVVQQMADLINEGRAQQLASISAVPFLLDGEIVPLKADVDAFWAGIVKAGFRVESPTLAGGAPVDASIWQKFSSSAEVQWYFTRYVKKGARVLDLGTSTGKHILVLTQRGFPSDRIMGFKGPF
jgi:hypothetical protein